MSELYTLRSYQLSEWRSLLEAAVQYDVYHLPEYHSLAERNGEGEAQLLVYVNKGRFIALPLLFRSTKSIRGIEDNYQEFRDATSVYGYPGPIASHDISKSFVHDFRQTLSQHLVKMNTISVFSRLNPLVNQIKFIENLGKIEEIGSTVSIDLTLPESIQWSLYRTNHKRDIKRLQRLGAVVIEDREKYFLKQFIGLYDETMMRVGASSQYFFSQSYYEDLFSMQEGSFHLFLCKLGDEIIAGGLFSHCKGIIQYHLGGTSTQHLNLSPIKLVFDEVRRWAMGEGAWVFHLGGGVGSQNDSLFEFKAGFSPKHQQFQIWKWIMQPDVYQTLTMQHRNWLKEQGKEINSTNYFPAYRAV